jgi:hypothetical protein
MRLYIDFINQISELELMMKSFVTDVEKGTHVQNGWANTCYGMSIHEYRYTRIYIYIYIYIYI